MSDILDFVIVGSGFGGSVSALRLTEKGYRVRVLERGKRFRDEDFARTNWNVRKALWAPALRCFGILQISPFRDVFVLHGAGVGGGSLGYANVLMAPGDEMFSAPAWSHLADWKSLLLPHYDTAKRMLGVAVNPRTWPADVLLKEIAGELGTADTWQPTPVGTFFGQPDDEGEEVPDPYFGGEGPARAGCIHCGGCMVGCRYNAKNTLVKNYLYLAEKWGAEVEAEAEVRDIVPLPAGQPDGARYEVVYRSASALLFKGQRRIRTRNVIVSAGALGTLRLLFRCRDVTGSLPRISPRLGDLVRTNNESLLGVIARDDTADYSQGIAITSIVHADAITTIEPVRYSPGSSMMRLLTGPIIDTGSGLSRLVRSVWEIISRPADFARTHFRSRWAQRTTIILAMQTDDTKLRFRFGRSLFTLFRRGLVSHPDPRERASVRHRGEPQGHAPLRGEDRRHPRRLDQREPARHPDDGAHPGRLSLRDDRRRRRGGARLPGARVPRPVCHRRVHRARQPGRQPEPHHHGAGGVRHEPGAGQTRRHGAIADRSSRSRVGGSEG